MKKFLSVLILLAVALPLFAQNPDFDLKYRQAKTLYEQGQYEKARTAIRNAIKNLPALSSEQISQGSRLASQCDQAIANRDRLNLGATELSLSFAGGRDSVSIDVGRKDKLTARSAAPDWCQIEGVADGFVYISAKKNQAKTPRQTDVYVSLGKIKTAILHVSQEARPETVKTVRIATVPDRARISMDNNSPITGTWEGTLSSGEHKIHIEKSGYEPRDTVITVADDMQNEEGMEVQMKLVPQFGMMTVNLIPEEGFDFDTDQPPYFTLNGVLVEPSSTLREVYSFDDDREIQRYRVYQDGLIPVSPGTVSMIAQAHNFEPERMQVQVKAGELVHVDVTLKAITGWLQLQDTGWAQDALVSMDGKEIGLVRDLVRERTIVGQHEITLSKPGFMSAEKSYKFNVREDEMTIQKVSMVRYTTCRFDSQPQGAMVSVDGIFVGTTPTDPYVLLEKPSHAYTVEVTMDGFLTMTRLITPNYSLEEQPMESFEMLYTQPFTITADEPGLDVLVKTTRKGDTTFVNRVPVPAEVSLPVRKKRYYVELLRKGISRPAYKGYFYFRKPEKNHLSIQAWPASDFKILTVNFNAFGLDPFPVGIGGSSNAKMYKHLGSADLANFRILPGLSTSVIHGSVFWGANNKSITVETESGNVQLPDSKLLPAFSVLFVNGQFRVGGSPVKFLDTNALVTYAWYPDFLYTIMPLSHMVGHDLFAGLEFGSRLPFVTISLRAGMQWYFDMKANIYDPSNKLGVNSTEQRFTKVAVQIPAQFVVGASIALGSRRTKGNNVLRLF
ncbi:MAG: PEGA domain-containing protein [Bacteroidales bacterium]|nr:PEGA domain-containing protein [Bacteroidales bacterium]